jgi:2-polyprenyl-6-methoxyphenol hydroxylase-like FAD-dependent oxidoreductase
MHVMIVGAGIGGLTAALRLGLQGIRVTIAEGVAELKPLGVGINLLPHGAAVLTELGLLDRLAETGIATRAIEYRTQFGQLILRDPRGLYAGSPWPQYSIHRGELQMLLLDAARAMLPMGSLRLGHRFEGFSQDAGEVSVSLRRVADGALVEEVCDLLIGADGTQSRVCAELHPGLGPLAFSGTMMWRGAVERDPFLDGETMVIAGHHDSKAVIYPISMEAARRGRALVNWVAEINVGRETHYQPGDWNRPGKYEEFIAPFEDWQFDFLDIPALFRATEQIFVYPMVDRDPLPFWTKGRVTLLGDAAHPMYPFGANGASQAILDADALGAAFAETGAKEIPDTLALYESQRLPATARVVASNRAKGPEAVLQLARERIRSPLDDVTALIAKEEIDAITRSYQETAGFDAATLARRATLAAAGVKPR